MGKENISFLTVWIILGKIFATFSSDPEPTTGTTTSSTGSSSSSTVFGRKDLSVIYVLS